MDYLLLRHVLQSMLDCLLVHEADDMGVHTYLAVISSPIGVRANHVSVEGKSLRLCQRQAWVGCPIERSHRLTLYFMLLRCSVPYLIVLPNWISIDITIGFIDALSATTLLLQPLERNHNVDWYCIYHIQPEWCWYQFDVVSLYWYRMAQLNNSSLPLLQLLTVVRGMTKRVNQMDCFVTPTGLHAWLLRPSRIVRQPHVLCALSMWLVVGVTIWWAYPAVRLQKPHPLRDDRSLLLSLCNQ